MRLIDANALDLKLQDERERLISLNMLGAEDILVHCAMKHVWEAPIIDAVSVVRCKDCKWRDEEEKHHCIDINRVFDQMDFCSFGERENNG